MISRPARLARGWWALLVLPSLACGGAASPAGGSSGGKATAGSAVTRSPATSSTMPVLSNQSPPPARTEFAVGDDPITGRVLIEGGYRTTPAGQPEAHPTGETWSWDGKGWRRLADGPAVANASMTVDPASGHLLLIGGANPVPDQVYEPQTGMWAWDGMKWSRVADNPAQTGISQAATDPVHRQVLISASGPTGDCPPRCSPTPAAYQQYGRYVWSGGAWSTAPSQFTEYIGASRAGMGFDPISARVIQQGASSQGAFNKTLAWDGRNWTVVKGDTDPPGSAPSDGVMASDGRQLLMLSDPLAGNDAIASTWTFDGVRWQRHVIAEPASQAQPVYDRVRRAFVAVGSRRGDSVLSVWVLTSLDDGWRWLQS